MIWVLLVVIGVIVGFIYGFSDGWSLGDKICNGILWGTTGLAIGLLMLLMMSFICYQPIETPELVETKEIYALKDNSYMSGHGSLLYVTIEEEDRYTYMITNDDGSFSKESITCEDVRVKEANNETPSLKKYSYKSKNELWSIHEETYYYFTVPTGTVTNVYSIDLE